jgi:hypothetical protein
MQLTRHSAGIMLRGKDNEFSVVCQWKEESLDKSGRVNGQQVAVFHG